VEYYPAVAILDLSNVPHGRNMHNCNFAGNRFWFFAQWAKVIDFVEIEGYTTG